MGRPDYGKAGQSRVTSQNHEIRHIPAMIYIKDNRHLGRQPSKKRNKTGE